MELNIDFFHIVNENVARKGRILISEPFLSDQYFRRSIVYLCESNEEGAMGFVLNKPLEINVNEVVEEFPESEFPISVGGPVANNTVHYIHTLGEKLPESIEVTDGLWWGGDFDRLKEMVLNNLIQPHQIRFFLGYAGWSPGQLGDELKDHAWLVGKIDPALVMQGMDPDFWSDTLAGYNNKYRAWANFPEDPGLN